MPDINRWLPRLFWLTAGGDGLLTIFSALREGMGPQGEFSGLFVFVQLLFFLCLLVVAVIVAAIRHRVAYGIGLALVSLPLLFWSSLALTDLAGRLAAPSIADQEAGRGYFRTPADRALADAIVAGDAGAVASLAPAANLNTLGWSGMTFMQLALEDGHAKPEVLTALLRAGIDPDQDSSALYQLIYNDKNEALLHVITDTGVDLNKHMGHGHWYLFTRTDWPEGLTLILDHGADIEVEDAEGYTEIMRETQAGIWPTVDLLLAHGARIDHVGHDGKMLRDLLPRAIAESRRPITPGIEALQARLR